jgi:hypothetical protein
MDQKSKNSPDRNINSIPQVPIKKHEVVSTNNSNSTLNETNSQTINTQNPTNEPNGQQKEISGNNLVNNTTNPTAKTESYNRARTSLSSGRELLSQRIKYEPVFK